MADNFTATPGHVDGGAECIVHDKAIVALVNNPLWICLAICCRTRRFNGNWQSQQIAWRGVSAHSFHALVASAKHYRCRRVRRRNKADNQSDAGVERGLGPRCANSRGARRLGSTIGRIYVCDLTDDRPARALLVGSGVHIHPVSAKRMWVVGGLRCPLRFCLVCRCVERRRRTDKLLECAGIYFRAVLNIDGAPHVAVQT